jgi:hypothetical protein
MVLLIIVNSIPKTKVVIKNISHRPNDGKSVQKGILCQPTPWRKKLIIESLYCKTLYEYLDDGSMMMSQVKKENNVIRLAIVSIRKRLRKNLILSRVLFNNPACFEKIRNINPFK